MKLFLPTLGTHLTLTKPWTFKLKDRVENEKWWTSLHGATPSRQVYFYGYTSFPQRRITSPVATSDCWKESYIPDSPILTVLPKGTLLEVKKIFIRKGMREYDSIVFKVPKGSSRLVPFGEFTVDLKEVNGKLEAKEFLPTKYPNGKFTIIIAKGKINMSLHPPEFLDEYLMWQSMGECSRTGGIVASVQHYRDANGVDEILDHRRYHYKRDLFVKSFDSIEELLASVKAKGLTDDHIKNFLNKYQEKKAEWDKEKIDV